MHGILVITLVKPPLIASGKVLLTIPVPTLAEVPAVAGPPLSRATPSRIVFNANRSPRSHVHNSPEFFSAAQNGHQLDVYILGRLVNVNTNSDQHYDCVGPSKPTS